MIFRRTISGIANLHLFFRVDAIVFCEGGEPLDVAAALAGSGDDSTLDCHFWRRAAAFVGARKIYHFKSVGSKSTLRQIAEDIAAHSIGTTIVCFDRDFDGHCQRLLNHGHVVYTRGYSWENDAVSEVSLGRLLLRFFPNDSAAESILASMSRELTRFGKAIAPWCETEITLSLQGSKPLFDREKPLASIDLANPIPRFTETRVRQSLTGAGYKRRPPGRVRLSKTEALQYCWGKMVSRYCYQLFVRAVAQFHAGFRLTYEAFMRLVVTETFEAMKDGCLSDQRDYYTQYRNVFA